MNKKLDKETLKYLQKMFTDKQITKTLWNVGYNYDDKENVFALGLVLGNIYFNKLQKLIKE